MESRAFGTLEICILVMALPWAGIRRTVGAWSLNLAPFGSEKGFLLLAFSGGLRKSEVCQEKRVWDSKGRFVM